MLLPELDMPSRIRDGSRSFLALSAISLALVTGLAAWFACAGAEPTKPRNAETSKSDRKPWTTSRVVGSPDPPPPFKVVRAFPNLKFEHPLLIARCPGMERLFVGEQAGVLYS